MHMAKLLKEHQYCCSYSNIVGTAALRCARSPPAEVRNIWLQSRKKNPILFIEIPWDVIIRVVSTFCFPLPYSLPTLQYQLIVRRGCGEATAPPCCWSPEEGVKRHKWPQYELLAQSFPSGSHVNVYVCTVESETKLQLGKSVLFLNTH